MVEFGKRLQQECAQQGADWQNHCIDYVALKQIIEKEEQEQKDRKDEEDRARAASFDGQVTLTYDNCDGTVAVTRTPSFTAVTRTTSFTSSFTSASNHAYYHRLPSLAEATPSLRFQYALDHEIEKAVLFVLREQGAIASDLDRLAVRRARFLDDASRLLRLRRADGGDGGGTVEVRLALDELGKLHAGYASAAKLVLRFVAFVDLNVTAVRKILKKHDKVTERKLSQSYLSAYADQYVDSHLDQLYNDGGLSSLVATLRRAFKELHRVEVELLGLLGATDRRIQSLPGMRVMGASHSNSQPAMLSSSTEWANGGTSLVTTQREPLLHLIQMSRDRLKKNTKYVDIVAAQALMFAGPDDEDADDADDASSKEMTRAQRLSSLLNLLSTFLYMTNYYIVAPTCGRYAARVGSDASMAGVVIGMTPNAALAATVLYGWWSNHSYKSALAFAASCSLLGNVAYALALRHGSMHLILLGRGLNGFGSARAINRRFIADTFSKGDRTAASAAFVTAGALGMACGPALAAFLSRLAFPPQSTLWTVETAPGWIMLFLWSLFLIALVVFFEEPDRSHIFGSKKPKVELTSKLAANNGEDKFLLADMPSPEELELTREPPLWKNVPVMVTLWVYFILKLVLEALMSSSPTMTGYYFGWDAQATGFFLAFLGLLMFPANMIVARLSHSFEDREIIYASLVAILCSILGFICHLPGNYSVIQYVCFGICIFISTNALEGPNMSLLSKTIPKSWAKGILNAGFLATEAGTVARSVGDVWITLASRLAGISGLLNAIFGPMLVLVSVSVYAVRQNYDRMTDEDDEDSRASNKSS